MQFGGFYSLNHSIVAWFAHLRYLEDVSQLSQIWGNVFGGNGVSVEPYAHPQQMKVLKHHIYVSYGHGMQFDMLFSRKMLVRRYLESSETDPIVWTL